MAFRPPSLRRGHDVFIVDNFARRDADVELGGRVAHADRLSETRLAAWREMGGREIGFERLNVAHDYRELLDCCWCFQPEAIVHFAEQRAAPYSMKSAWHKRYTVDNNMNATNNVLAAIVDTGSTRTSSTSGRWASTGTAPPG